MQQAGTCTPVNLPAFMFFCERYLPYSVTHSKNGISLVDRVLGFLRLCIFNFPINRENIISFP